MACVAYVESFSGACDADKKQSPFLFDVVTESHASFMRQESFFESYDKCIVKLQALGGMESHQRDLAGCGVIGIGIAVQGDSLKVIDKGGFLCLFIVPCGGIDQFVYVIVSGFFLFTACHECVCESGFFEDAVHQWCDGAGHVAFETFDHSSKGGYLAACALCYRVDIVDRLGDGVGALEVAFGVGCDPVDSRFADPAFEAADSTDKCLIVVRVDHQLEVADHVANLFSGIKLHASYDLIRNLLLDESLFDNPAH